MEQIKLFLALGGLLILALITASALRRYQEVMAERRMRIKRLLRGVDMLRDLLNRLQGCLLPVELESILFEDILARLQRVRRVDASFRGIEALIERAEQEKRQPRQARSFDIGDLPRLNRITQSLGELMEFLGDGRLLSPLTSDRVGRFKEMLGELRAESVYRFHTQEAERLKAGDRLKEALKHYNSVRSFLKQHGPTTSQVKEWYREADTLWEELREQIDGSTSAA